MDLSALEAGLAAAKAAHKAAIEARVASSAAAAKVAIANLSKTSIDEMRAIRGAPPPTVGKVVCCVCTILRCDPRLGISGRPGMPTGLVAWDEAAKMLAKEGFRQSLEPITKQHQICCVLGNLSSSTHGDSQIRRS